MKLPSFFQNNPFSNIIEKDKKPKLTSEQMWDFVFWSFFYSRGRSVVQLLMFEYLKRTYELDKKFDPRKVPEKIVERTVSFRVSSRHANAEPEIERTKTEDALESSAFELSRLADLLKNTMFRKNIFTNEPESELMRLFASSLIMIDYNWVCKNGSKTSHIKNFFFNKDVKMLGDNVFEKMKADLSKYLERAVESDKKIDQIVTEIYENSAVSNPLALVELSQKELWGKIIQCLETYAKRT